MKCLLALSLVLLITSCKNNGKQQTLQEKQKELGAGTLDERSMYSVKEVGWTVQLPKEWNLITKRQSAENTKKGQELVEQSIGATINTSALVELVSVQKNKFNSFESTMEPFDTAKDGSYENQNAMIHELIKQTYKAKNIYAEYDTGTISLDGVLFDWFFSTIYSPDKEECDPAPENIQRPDQWL